MLTVIDLPDVPEDFLPDHPEGGAFCRAYARARVPGFVLGCFEVRRDGRAVAQAPYFVMRLPLNTMLPAGWLKRLLQGVALKIAFVGHPSADVGQIQGERSPEVLLALNEALLRKAPLASYKGFEPGLEVPGFQRVIGLPVPVLPVSPGFWAELKHKVRTDLKRKLKASAGLRFEETQGLPASLLQPVHALYRQTCERSDIQFEDLPPAYFEETAALSRYILCFEGERLVGFHQLICSQRTMCCKYIGMDYAIAHEHKLYFALMLRAVDICIREGMAEVDFGVTSYAFKRYVGSEMHEVFNHFRHRNRVVNALLSKLSFLLEPDPSELL